MWCVGEGPPSWHQRRAGSLYAAVTTGFITKDEAEALASRLRSHHPGKTFTVFYRPTP